MRRVRAAVAGIAVTALTVGVAAPAGAQEEPEALGFAVDKTEAQPGALVLGKVDTNDVAEHCTTTVEGVQARFQSLFDLYFVDFDSSNPVFDAIFPDASDPFDFAFVTHEQQAYMLVGFLAVFIGFPPPDTPAEEVLAESFVMTFADIATQEPVGERDTFDPEVGEASVVVPEVEPGLWAVAAACVTPTLDVDTLIEGIREGAAFLEEIGAPEVDANSEEYFEFMRDFLDTDNPNDFGVFLEFLEEVAPNVLEPIMVPEALGAVLFCVLDAEGKCPADEPPPPPPGGQIDLGDDEAGPAQPIVAAPTFTG